MIPIYYMCGEMRMEGATGSMQQKKSGNSIFCGALTCPGSGSVFAAAVARIGEQMQRQTVQLRHACVCHRATCPHTETA